MAEKVTLDDLDDVQAFLNKEDCLARSKYLGKQELVLVSAFLEIKIRESDSRVEILSKVHKHLKAGEKQESEAQRKERREREREEREREEKREREEREREREERERERVEQEREKERQERRDREEKERQHELEILRLGGRRKTTETSGFDPLVPEAYRQKFRNLKKTSEHTFTEFATIKERLFQEWCASRKVRSKEELEQLVLLEDFKECLSGDLKTYLEEQQVETLRAAATMAEEYILTHRSSTRKHEVIVTEATEQEERPRVQVPKDTQESGVEAPEYLQYGKVQRSSNRPEISQTSEVPVSLKDDRTGVRNVVRDQPPTVPRHREVSIRPTLRRCRSLLKTREIMPLLAISVKVWEVTSGRSLTTIFKFSLC
ncbi:cyclin-dependent kinase 11B-like [Procambarus clarkii]|uniref:cyclin-dependent kinase 11B-like n=1 Tax=Procambarus clarkii TaxID=6728 RepID=UPI00374289D0